MSSKFEDKIKTKSVGNVGDSRIPKDEFKEENRKFSSEDGLNSNKKVNPKDESKKFYSEEHRNKNTHEEPDREKSDSYK